MIFYIAAPSILQYTLCRKLATKLCTARLQIGDYISDPRLSINVLSPPMSRSCRAGSENLNKLRDYLPLIYVPEEATFTSIRSSFRFSH